MKPKKVGTMFVEMAGLEPYKLWSGDLLECAGCGEQILYTTPTQTPVAEQYQPDFNEQMNRYNPQFLAFDRKEVAEQALKHHS
jgi:hypothetical protein